MSEMDHPYKEFENLRLWKSIDEAVAGLEANRDITLTTAREYVIGFLVTSVMDGYSDFGDSDNANPSNYDLDTKPP